MNSTDLWSEAASETIVSYRRMIDAAIEQLTDEEFFQRPAPEMNSVAIILRHLGGNLQSRWTDFLNTDGEKPNRHRESEFEEWDGDRVSLLEYFDQGWSRLAVAAEQFRRLDSSTEITIRGESHSLPQAMARSITHVAYHVGQIVLIARMVHEGDWKWLTIAPGQSDAHNKTTWGTPKSRSTFGSPSNR